MLWFKKKTNKKHHDARKEYIKQKLILEMLEYFLIARKMQNLRYTLKAMPAILKLYNKTVIESTSNMNMHWWYSYVNALYILVKRTSNKF